MKIVKVSGGLGNQMFQYAFAKAYSLKNNCEVLLDISWYENEDDLGVVAKRNFELEVFNINLKFATKEEIEICKDKKSNSHLPKLIRKVLNRPKCVSNEVFEKDAGVFDSELLNLKDNAYYEGFFQSEKYFKDFRDEILKDFTLKLSLDDKNNEMLKQITSTNSVSLHVRRGDYVKLQSVYKLCTLDYYNQAINFICQRVENPHFYIFSDDCEWVRENLKIEHENTIVNINKEGYFDLELMKNCKHNIIANSSFSWWGAWLNNGIVVAPKTWFVKMLDTDIIPENWTRL